MNHQPADRGMHRWFRPTRSELLLLAAIVGVYLLVAFWLIAAGAPLGHDESVYALKSRQLHLGGTSAWYWNDYRAPGLPLLLQVTWLVSGTEPFLRLTVWGFGAAGLVLVWILGRMLFDAATGLIAAAGLALTAPWLASSVMVWPDIPGAVLGLAAITIVLAATGPSRTSWWIVGAVPVALAAVMVRYGALFPIGIGVLAVIVWRRDVVRRSLPQYLVATGATVAASLAVLLIPALTGATTSPLSSMRTLQSENAFSVTQGIRDYAERAGFILGGYAGLLLIAGLGLGALYALRERQRRSAWLFVLAWMGATAVLLALILHGEYRYLSPVYPLVWLLAGWGLAETVRRIPREPSLVIGVVLAVLAPINAASSAGTETDLLAERFGDLRVVSRAIDAEHGYEECGVLTSYIPQVAWYTECVTRRFEPSPVLSSPFFAQPEADYLLLVTGGKRQPEGASLDAYMDVAGDVFTESGDPHGGNLEYAVVYELGE